MCSEVWLLFQKTGQQTISNSNPLPVIVLESMTCVLEMGFASLNDVFLMKRNFRMCDYVKMCEHCMKFNYNVKKKKKTKKPGIGILEHSSTHSIVHCPCHFCAVVTELSHNRDRMTVNTLWHWTETSLSTLVL